jgi:hypothetical protein
LFRTSGAVSNAPAAGGLKPDVGIDLTYFTGPDGFSRAMAEVGNPKGVVWIDGVCTVADEQGGERLIAHFQRREGLGTLYEHGLMLYNDEREIFEVKTTLPNEETWRFLRDHPVRIRDGNVEYLACGGPFPLTRVPARLDDILDPAKYQSWSCFDAGSDPDKAAPRRDPQGALAWKWQTSAPVTQKVESRWLKAGLIKPEECRYLPEDAEKPGRRVALHNGTVNWNTHRKLWVLVGNEFNMEKESPSMLGEVWYSESESPQGPWRKAVRIVSHDKQSFYNPCHHALFDEANGRLIYFEGTYTNSFTHSRPTPLYEYNQMMYRLDLDHPALQVAFPRGEK